MYRIFYDVSKEKKNHEVRKLKATHSTDHCFNALYFTMIALIGLEILKNSTGFQQLLMIPGQTKMYDNFPLIPNTKEQRLFFLITMGHPFLQTYEIFDQVDRNNGHKIVQHFLLLSFYVSSYVINCVELAFLVVYCYALSTVFIHYSKSFSNTHFNFTSFLSRVFMWITFLFFRILAFPRIVWYGIII